MGDLKPLGSEKLEGIDKIKRILEISRYNENIPNPVNETSKEQYKINLADGNEYQIVREKSGYIIKRTISESKTEYIDPIKHRKYYPSYSQALKRLNLMAKETNVLFENEEGISLFEQKKFVLKTPKPKTPPPPEEDVENVPPPAPEPVAPPPPAGGMGGSTPPPPEPEGDMGGSTPPPPPEGEDDETPMPDEGDEDVSSAEMDGDEVVTFKGIQKLVGRLGQKLRTINADEENKMSSKDVKYVINSVLSALDLNSLDEDDREQIINKFEGTEEEMGGSEDEMGGSEDEMGGSEDEMGGSEEGTPPPPPPEMGEMIENTDHDDVTRIADSLFKEQKVEQILFKYFRKSKNEKKYSNVINENRKIRTQQKNRIINSEIKRLSESVIQEVSARKLIQKYPGLKFVGKSNKKNLVFENSELNQFKITPNGDII